MLRQRQPSAVADGRHAGRADHDGRERGSLIVELVVALVVSAVLFSALSSMTIAAVHLVQRTDGVARASVSLRSALATTGKTLSMASAVSTPGQVGRDWYLEALLPATPASVTPTCRQWRLVDATEQLQERSWNTVDPRPTQWATVARDVVNDPTTQPPFTVLPPDDAYPVYRVHLELVALMPELGETRERADLLLRNSNAPATAVCTQVGR